MGNLFISFTIAICASVGLVSLSRAFDFEFYTSRTLPLIPILYAIIYEVLDHRKTVRTRTLSSAPVQESVKVAAPAIGRGLAMERVLMDVGVSFAVKFLIEIFLFALFLRFSGQSFSEVTTPGSRETKASFCSRWSPFSPVSSPGSGSDIPLRDGPFSKGSSRARRSPSSCP
jgi:hypothetical protein